METDRWAILIQRAAARGIVDFGRCNPLNPAWWKKILKVLNALAREDDVLVYESALHVHLALLASPRLSETGYKELSDAAQNTFRDLVGAIQPWVTKTKAADETANQLTQKYKEHIGDTSDPAFMQKLTESLARQKEERRRKRELLGQGADERLEKKLLARDRRMIRPPVRKPRRV